MSGLRTQAAPMSLADMHERLGRFAADASGYVHGNKMWDSRLPSTLRNLEIEAVVRNPRPAPTDTGDLRALQADWDETDRLMDAARAKLRKHGNTRLYRIECQQIIARESGQ